MADSSVSFAGIANVASKAQGRAFLKRQGSRLNSKTLLVAMDGSFISNRALRLAVFMMNESAKDIIRVITIRSDKEGAADPAQLMQSARADLIKYGVQPGRIRADPRNEVLSIKEGLDLPNTICFEAARDPNTLLIMGAAGKNAEGAEQTKAKRAQGQAPMGHIAEKVMQNCVAPVLLVKGLATPGLNTDEGMHARRMRASGDDAKLVIMCAISHAGDLSRTCFDLAARFARPGDSVKVVHVKDTFDLKTEDNEHMGSSAVANYYMGECSKQEDAKPGTSFTYHALPKKGSAREVILEKAEEWLADILVVGSVELAKTAPGPDGSVLGSVSSAVAKKTQCHTLIAKAFKGV